MKSNFELRSNYESLDNNQRRRINDNLPSGVGIIGVDETIDENKVAWWYVYTNAGRYKVRMPGGKPYYDKTRRNNIKSVEEIEKMKREIEKERRYLKSDFAKKAIERLEKQLNSIMVQYTSEQLKYNSVVKKLEKTIDNLQRKNDALRLELKDANAKVELSGNISYFENKKEEIRNNIIKIASDMNRSNDVMKAVVQLHTLASNIDN